MAAKKASKAALNVKEAAAVVKYDLKASEDKQAAADLEKATAGHIVDMDHMVDNGHGPNGRHSAMGHNWQKSFLKEGSYFRESIF